MTKQNFGTLKLFFSIGLLVTALGSSLPAQAKLGKIVLPVAEESEGLPICFVVGAGGGNEYTMEKFIPEMKSRGIEWVPFSPGARGTVVERAEIFVKQLAAHIEKNPGFRCHAFGYSMGGLVLRYSYHHLEMDVPGVGIVSPADVFVSYSTFSSPHRGTPLASWLKHYGSRFSRGVDDLSEEAVLKYNSPEYPETYSPAPTEIPVYSYLTFIKDRSEAKEFVTRAGFQLIERMYEHRGLDTRNDGIVPLISQPMGKVVAAVQAEHMYFDRDIGLRPWAPDVYEMHWRYLEGETPADPLHYSDSPAHRQQPTAKQSVSTAKFSVAAEFRDIWNAMLRSID